ncbi:histone deacetylase complex subunit SAP130-A [Caerostris darwini]|uniref:Histone deacetylase complex subunit SAP130-A n=1 Tax=Caerostris darwini TaxID=1538125 RepID=A0AAV4WYB0_9ARAC|nr:histone deacetylase complex subunit SAP130-A [Caerostris darwini]
MNWDSHVVWMDENNPVNPAKIIRFAKMNNQKTENKADHDENDHTQPINLVAARTVAPATAFTGASTGVSSQPLAMRSHVDAPKPGLMLKKFSAFTNIENKTLYFRTPAPRPSGQVMAPVVGNQVSSTQHFTAKQAQDFKNSGISSWTVIRMPSSEIAPSGTTTASSSGGLTPGILPSALSGGARHMIPTAVHPVIAAGNSGPSMASIIRSSHPMPPSGHVIHQQSFSSHVPRGPAAVASISAAPKSAVATPILRTPHSSATMALSSSSMMALHTPVRAKSPTLINRTATPPMAASNSLSQDLQKLTAHSLSSNTHIGLGSRTIDGSVVRTGPSHSSSITIAKPINSSQPIVQHLQQVHDKSNLKPVSNLSSTTSSTSNSTPAHQTVPPSGFTSGSESVSVVPTISRSGYSTSIMQLSPAAVGQSIQTLRATHVNPALHSMSSSSAPHQTLTVISAKSLMPTNHSIALATTTARSVTPNTSVNASGIVSVVPSLSSRPNAINATTIPVAKVYPQSPVTSRAISEPSIPDNARVGNFPSQSFVSNSSRVTTSNTTPQNVMITEKQIESNSSVRFTSLSKPQVGNSVTYAPSSTTYLYHDQYPNLAIHPYTPSPSGGTLSSTQLRPASFSQHSTSSNTSHSPAATSNTVQPINSVMVAVDSRHHVALHPSYGGKNAEVSSAPLASNGSSVGPTPVVTTSYNTLQTQGNVTNHTSPRPSILRKRTSESLNTVVKKNLSNNLCVSEPISPRPDINSNANFTSVLSPKPNNEKIKETATTTVSMSSEILNIPSTLVLNSAIRKETGPLQSRAASSFCTAWLSVSFSWMASDFKGHFSQKPDCSKVGILVLPSHYIKHKITAFTLSYAYRHEYSVEFSLANAVNNTEASMKNVNTVEASPRKKPRKQLLATNEISETHSSEGENNFDGKVKFKEQPDEEKTKYVTFSRKPNISLLHTYRQSWKARHNHFARYSDVKPKEEKRPTVNELANQKGIVQEVNGWKVYHLTAQMEEIVNLEETVHSRLSHLLDFVEKDNKILRNRNNSDEDRIINKLTDLIKGNMQRSKLVQEQIAESNQQAIKILDHKTSIVEIINKYVSRRPLKKKDKS